MWSQVIKTATLETFCLLNSLLIAKLIMDVLFLYVYHSHASEGHSLCVETYLCMHEKPHISYFLARLVTYPK